MTGQEKKMNKQDLHDYKRNNNKYMQAMIPGIHNLETVGSSPLRRGMINKDKHKYDS